MMNELEDLCNKICSCNSIACINSKDVDSIQQGIVKVLKQEKLEQISKPPLCKNFQPLIAKLLSSPWLMTDLVVIGLYPSNTGWTVIKTSSENFLCKRAKNALEPRLLTLAKYANFDAFAYSFQYAYTGALIEASANGKMHVSGFMDNGGGIDGDEVFCQESINKMTHGLYFNLLKVSRQLQSINEQPDIDLETRKKELKKLELVERDPEQINHVLSKYCEIHSSAFVRADENLKEFLSCSNYFWRHCHLLYDALVRSQWLEDAGVKLLFFKPKDVGIGDIWLSFTSKKDYGKELWQDIPF